MGVDTFLEKSWECAAHLSRDGGEDGFIKDCLDAMNVSHMNDFALLNDKYSWGSAFNLQDVDTCKNGQYVAFHPYKAVNTWLGCFKVANGINSVDDFVNCGDVRLGEACTSSSWRHHNPGDPSGNGILR